MSCANLLELPPEILSIILCWSPDARSFACMLLTCREFAQLITPKIAERMMDKFDSCDTCGWRACSTKCPLCRNNLCHKCELQCKNCGVVMCMRELIMCKGCDGKDYCKVCMAPCKYCRNPICKLCVKFNKSRCFRCGPVEMEHYRNSRDEPPTDIMTGLNFLGGLFSRRGTIHK